MGQSCKKAGLTDRQYVVAAMLAEGFALKEIADRLNISLGNVNARLRWGRQAVKARSNTHLAALVARWETREQIESSRFC